MTGLFWILAGALAAAGAGFLVWPLLSRTPAAHIDRRAAALAAHRDLLAEIESREDAVPGEREAGREARDDVARALLRDLDAGESPDGPRLAPARLPPRRGAAVALCLVFLALAATLYAWLGEPGAIHPSAAPAPARTALAVGHEVGRLLGEAETLARAKGNRLDGEPARLIDRALVLVPDHRKALWFGAIAALHEDRPRIARARLERLRGLGPLDEDEARMFEQLMREASARDPGP